MRNVRCRCPIPSRCCTWNSTEPAMPPAPGRAGGSRESRAAARRQPADRARADPARAADTHRRAPDRIDDQPAQRRGERGRVAGRDQQPGLADRDNAGNPPLAPATTGSPLACASSSAMPNASLIAGQTNRSASRSAAASAFSLEHAAVSGPVNRTAPAPPRPRRAPRRRRPHRATSRDRTASRATRPAGDTRRACRPAASSPPRSGAAAIAADAVRGAAAYCRASRNGGKAIQRPRSRSSGTTQSRSAGLRPSTASARRSACSTARWPTSQAPPSRFGALDASATT